MSTKQLLNIKHRCLNFLKTVVDEVSMTVLEKFKFFDTVQVFHLEVLLSQNKCVPFQKFNRIEFCSGDENLGDLKKKKSEYQAV